MGNISENDPVGINRAQEEIDSLPPAQPAKKNILSRNRNFIAVTTLGIGALGAIGGQLYADDPLFFPAAGIEFLTEQACPPTPNSAMEEVVIDFESPDTPRMEKILKHADIAIKTHDEAGIQKVISQLDNYRKNMAEKYGFTLQDSRESLDSIESATSNSAMLTAVQEYFSGLGISITDQPDLIKDMAQRGKNLNLDSISPEVFRQISRNLITVFSRFPKELVAFSELDRIVLWEKLPEALGVTINTNHTIHLVADVFIDEYDSSVVANHEFGHAIDGALCGIFGSRRDPEYAGLNTPDFQYGSFENYENNVMYGYGDKNILEDKGIVLESMLDTIRNPYELSPVVQAKQKLLLARLEANLPGIAGYLRSISNFDPEAEFDPNHIQN